MNLSILSGLQTQESSYLKKNFPDFAESRPPLWQRGGREVWKGVLLWLTVLLLIIIPMTLHAQGHSGHGTPVPVEKPKAATQKVKQEVQQEQEAAESS